MEQMPETAWKLSRGLETADLPISLSSAVSRVGIRSSHCACQGIRWHPEGTTTYEAMW